MRIVIAGAGEVGFHLAKLLSVENQEIVLVDREDEVLQYAATHLDVMTIKGDCSSIAVLKKAGVDRASLFLAMTTTEKTNLLAAILAKKLGAKKTIARVVNPEYLERDQRDNFLELGVDVLISPQELAAQEIERLLSRSATTDLFEFEGGKISIVGFTVDHGSPFDHKTIREVAHSNAKCRFRVVAILRAGHTFIPNGDTLVHGSDHLYLATNKNNVDLLTTLAGKQRRPVRKVMIVGSTWLAQRTAQRLEDKYRMSIVAKDREQCREMVESLHTSLIINGDPGNIDLLKEEGLTEMDALLALTDNTETNILTSLMAKELGVPKTIALVDNAFYTRISQNIGVDTIINKKIIAANNIFRHVRKGKVEAITSLHGVEGEIIEFHIQKESILTRSPIKGQYFPKDAIIAGIIRGNESHIPNSTFQMQVGDMVIVFAQVQAIQEVEEMFN